MSFEIKDNEMKKKIELSGGLKEMVSYCTAIYELDNDVDADMINDIIKQSPIFENKSFYTNVLGTVQRTTVNRNSKVFIKGNRVTLQIRYEILRVVDIEPSQKDEDWIQSDINNLLKHFELLLGPIE
jgi:anaerobic ribonucleoside-triphosphate reductase